MKTLRGVSLLSSGLGNVALLSSALSLGAIANASPVHLRVNQRVNPLGIDAENPVFSWQSDATGRDWVQKAYRVVVATSADKAKRGQGDVWDTGKVARAESVNVLYAGPALQSRQRYFWAVTTWDAKGKEEKSVEGAWWEAGIGADWKAQWIRRSDAEEDAAIGKTSWLWLNGADADKVPQGTVAEFKYTLDLEVLPAAAVLRVLAAGNFTARVNGVVTGHKDEWGAFDWEDIRDRLHVGPNEIVVTVTATGDVGKARKDAFAAGIRLTNQPGQSRWIGSDGEWQARQIKPTETAWNAAQPVGSLTEKGFSLYTDRRASAPAPDRIGSPVALLRKQFTAEKKVASARLYVTALGSYEAYLNGKAVTTARLLPGFTDYRKRVLYQTYDVTALVTQGKNTLGAVLGSGWHGSPLLWSGSRLFPGPDRLCAQLELTFTDGSRQTVATDETWEAAASPILSSEIYGGEAYDARRAVDGWGTGAAGVGRQWRPVVAEKAPIGLLVTAQPDAPVHSAETIKPVGVKMVEAAGEKAAVFDMGQNMVGVVKLRVKGPRGATVKLQFAERLNPDGTVYTENLRDADATDFYTLSGKGDEEWEPAFTFHGFRYVQVSGYDGAMQMGSIEGEVWNSLPAAPSIRFKSSSNVLNKMSELGLWGQRGNFLSIPTDCPQRDERMGWMGDAGAFWRTGSYNFDIDAFTQKFALDMQDGQTADGAFPNIAPNLLQGVEGDPGAPGWGDAGVLVTYATWLQYGDAAVANQQWPAMERWMKFIRENNPDFIRRNNLGPNYADWLAPDPHTPTDLVATAYWMLIAKQMETMADALGKASDASRYADLQKSIRDAYQKKYVKADGEVEGDTQSAYVLTLAMGLAPEEMKSAMTERLVKDIKTHGTHLTTGFLGTPYLLSALEEQGRADVAYELLLNTTYPSWGYMVDKGATTWWERWNGDTGDPSMNSYNHYAFGSVMAWVYRRVAGIDADPKDPGFHHVVIRPHVEAGLDYVKTEYDSAYGTVKTEWTSKTKGQMELKVTVPANASATVSLPSGMVKLDGKAVPGGEATVGSGTYVFSQN